MNYLAVFARPAIAGETKTRLIPALGPDGAGEIYQAFLNDIFDKVSESETHAVLWAAGDITHESFSGWKGERERQPDGELDEKMSAAIASGLSDHDGVVIVGTDSPTLNHSLVTRAFETLKDVDTVFGPSGDGGYYLVGSRVELSFRDVPWSSPDTLDRSLSYVQARGLSYRLLPPWYDVDVPADLRLLSAHLALDPHAAPATAAFLASLVKGATLAG